MNSTRRRTALLVLCGVILNLLLFAPAFIFRNDGPDWTPFFPREHPGGAFGRDLRSVVEYPKALLLRRSNPDMFRVSLDWLVLCVGCVFLAKSRAARPARFVASALYVTTLVFLFYEHAFSWFFVRPATIAQDWVLAVNLAHFLVELRTAAWLLATLGCLLTIVALMYATTKWLEALQRADDRRLRLALVASFIWGVASLAWFGIERDDAVVQLVSKRIAFNVERSRLEARRWAQAGAAAPDRRYDAFSRIALNRKPNVSLLVIEAYGEVLSTWDMTGAYRALMERVSRRLESSGYYTATFLSAAPVHGGFSWLSMATMETGVLIDRPDAFQLATTGSLPTLGSFFKQQGYFTVAMQPGTSNKPGVGPRDWVGFDRFVGAEELAYEGRPWGFGRIPDQFSLATMARERTTQPNPRYFFYMSVSTHFPWGDHVPPYLTPDAVAGGTGPDSLHDATWEALAREQDIGDYRRSYFRSVEYEFRLLTEFLETDPTKEQLVIIIGDHQPRLESNPPGEVTMNTPMHVISKDAALVRRFIDEGATPGMFVTPGQRAPLQHEGLFSLIVWSLAQQYGDAASRVLGQRSPDGAALSSLHR